MYNAVQHTYATVMYYTQYTWFSCIIAACMNNGFAFAIMVEHDTLKFHRATEKIDARGIWIRMQNEEWKVGNHVRIAYLYHYYEHVWSEILAPCFTYYFSGNALLEFVRTTSKYTGKCSNSSEYASQFICMWPAFGENKCENIYNSLCNLAMAKTFPSLEFLTFTATMGLFDIRYPKSVYWLTDYYMYICYILTLWLWYGV